MLKVLLVDTDRHLREGAARVLELDGHSVVHVGRPDEALSLLRQRSFNLLITELELGKISGIDLLRTAHTQAPDTLVIVTTGSPTVESNLAAIEAGAWEYLPKPFAAAHLRVLVGRAAHHTSLEAKPVAPRTTGRGRPTPAIRETPDTPLLGANVLLQKAIALAEKVAATDASVMISGESGTGKELIAQFIHARSRRAGKPLVAVNCAALPDNLLESEMFGYRRGAFTGADRDKAGLLEIANGATLLLDELTEMAMPLQAKLLRVLQDGVVRRLGSETNDAIVDVRFISATNRDPQMAVQQGVLREDLYYRLRVVPIRLPPLRSRPDDIILLATHFLRRSWERHHRVGDAPEFDEDTLSELQSRPWRGNVRELQNLVEHVAVISEPASRIMPDDLPGHDDDIMPTAVEPNQLMQALLEKPFHTAKDELVSRFEKEYVRSITARTRGNMSKAARLAGVDRTTLYRLLEKHDENAPPVPDAR